ncbi:MAG: hypothetical protein GYB50_05605 [Rhodobacteraceae bacterium]|nr:hypothetical protein [Salipiger thiooxidans]MBR9837346.1 hypothetical protein [Paracoccaceae bacterium]
MASATADCTCASTLHGFTTCPGSSATRTSWTRTSRPSSDTSAITDASEPKGGTVATPRAWAVPSSLTRAVAEGGSSWPCAT